MWKWPPNLNGHWLMVANALEEWQKRQITAWVPLDWREKNYSWPSYAQLLLRSDPAFLVAQNLPAMQETPVRSLGWEDLLEKGVNPCGIKSLNSVLTKARELRCIYWYMTINSTETLKSHTEPIFAALERHSLPIVNWRKIMGQEEEYACNFLKTPNYMFIYRSIYLYLPGDRPEKLGKSVYSIDLWLSLNDIFKGEF